MTRIMSPNVPWLWHVISAIVYSPLIVSFTVISGQAALIRAVQFIRVFPTWVAIIMNFLGEGF